jgi:YD repeat-containing protein
MKAIMPCVMKFTPCFVAGEFASRYVVGPAIEGAIGGLTGNPVELTTRRKVIPDETDFSEYDPAGELIRTLDKLRGEIKYEYEANGQLHSRDTGRLVDSEEFRYDAAANRLNFNTSQLDQPASAPAPQSTTPLPVIPQPERCDRGGIAFFPELGADA